MRKLVFTTTLLINISLSGVSQLYFPNENYYTNEIDRYYLSHSNEKSFLNSHLSSRPILDKHTNSDSIYYKNTKHYYWITQKLFKENFLIFQGKDFWCSVDPIIDLEAGTDLAIDSLKLYYWNSRGIRVQAKFLDKIAFSTSFYETQAIPLQYIANYANNHGVLTATNTGYKQTDAVIPGYARTKQFKTNGYDFSFAEGQVSIAPNNWINFHFGNGNQFIGNGYRSLLLSDFTANYPFAKIQTNLWDGRIQYTAIYAIHQNLYRIPIYESVEATFERKLGSYHYLDIAITKDLQIGLFEGSQWKRSDSLGTHDPNWLFINPLPFINGALMSSVKQDYNAIFGLNYSYTFLKNRLYGQLVLDNKQLGGIQIGLKSMEQFVKGLDFQLEFNHVPTNTYISHNKRYNYSHFNLPLAHPLTSGFNEGIIHLIYEKNSFFISNKTNYYNQKYGDSLADGTDIIFDDLIQESNLNKQRNVTINKLEIGYRFNKNYNLQAVLGWLYREEHLSTSIQSTSFFYFGLKSCLRNKTLDF